MLNHVFSFAIRIGYLITYGGMFFVDWQVGRQAIDCVAVLENTKFLTLCSLIHSKTLSVPETLFLKYYLSSGNLVDSPTELCAAK